jgi:AraC-like DNA-binding protein/mannose-6-phosphate isomerase-like protein (cupin superfamily)
MQTPVRTPVPLREVQPGKFFESITRPPLATPALPYRVEFGHVHMVDARESHHGVSPHRHLHYEFIIVEKGEYRCLVNDADVAAGPGGVIIIKPGDWHRDQCFTPVVFYALVLRVTPGPDPELSANLLREDLPATQQVLRETDGSLHALAERMRDEGRRGDPFTAPLLDSLAQEFAWRLMRLLPHDRLDRRIIGGMDLHGFGSELLALFERHIDGNLSPIEMAEALRMSERTLTSRCRAAFQAAPAKLFARIRMERARVLLVQTDLSVKAVAECLGFGNPYHFSTVYKRVHGVPPTHHRPG